jgi:hypothetical protein
MIQMIRTFASTAPDPSIDNFLIKPEDTKEQIKHGYAPGDYPVRYATLYPFVFAPNTLPPSYQLNYSMGLGSG